MEIIYGKSVVLESITNNHKAYNLYVDQKLKDSTIEQIKQLAKNKKINIKLVDTIFLDKMTKGLHQGVALEIEDYKYYDLDSVLKSLNKTNPITLFNVWLFSLSAPD